VPTLLEIRVFKGFSKNPKCEGSLKNLKGVFKCFFGKTSWMKVLD
jgi:hypothetical protein